MKVNYKFKYRSKVYQNLCVFLQSIMLSIFTSIVIPLVNCCLVTELDWYFVDDHLVMFMLVGALVVFILTICRYYFGKKGVSLNQNKLVIYYSCADLGVHPFCTKIKYCDIKSAEICTQNLNDRILEVEGGDYTNGYAVIHYKKNKTVRLPVENADAFIRELHTRLNKV